MKKFFKHVLLLHVVSHLLAARAATAFDMICLLAQLMTKLYFSAAQEQVKWSSSSTTTACPEATATKARPRHNKEMNVMI
jgi:hypothetical protein